MNVCRIGLVMALGFLLSFGLPAQTSGSLETVLVGGGAFTMGSDKFGASHEGPSHQVTVRSFRMAVAELSKADFKAFVDATGYLTTSETGGGAFTFMVAAGDGFFQHKANNWKNPNFKQADDHPAVAISWLDAIHYCNWRSQLDRLSPVYTINGDQVSADFNANGWRLPTEAEWEYAARGGKYSRAYRYAGSDTITDVAWSAYDSGWVTHAAKQKKPNEIGLYDMTGNADEWCWDWYGSYSSEDADNPTGPEKGIFRVQRGGNWYNQALYTDDPRLTQRYFSEPKKAYNTSGVRLVRY